MKRQASIAILRGVKTSLFLLAVIGASTFLSLSNPRPAQAEGLLYRLTCTVSGLFGRSCTPASEPTTTPPPPPSNGGSDTDTTKPASGDTKEPSTTESTTPQTVETFAPIQPTQPPIQLDEELLEEVPSVASVEPTGSSYIFPAHVAPSLGTGSDPAVLGQTTSAPIEASQGGWMILGVSWVWWVGAAVLVVAGAYAGKRLMTYRKQVGVAKS